MKIRNVVQTESGIVRSIESFITNDELAKTNNFFFTEKDAIKKAEDLFVQCIKDNYRFDEEQNEKEIIKEALEQGIFADEGGNYYEVVIFWSGINVNE